MLTNRVDWHKLTIEGSDIFARLLPVCPVGAHFFPTNPFPHYSARKKRVITLKSKAKTRPSITFSVSLIVWDVGKRFSRSVNASVIMPWSWVCLASLSWSLRMNSLQLGSTPRYVMFFSVYSDFAIDSDSSYFRFKGTKSIEHIFRPLLLPDIRGSLPGSKIGGWHLRRSQSQWFEISNFLERLH